MRGRTDILRIGKRPHTEREREKEQHKYIYV